MTDIDVVRILQARCYDCGWNGPERYFNFEARHDADEHASECTTP